MIAAKNDALILKKALYSDFGEGVLGFYVDHQRGWNALIVWTEFYAVNYIY